MEMEKIAQVVEGHPLGNLGAGPGDVWLMVCSECGALGVSTDRAADDFAFDHLTTHGAEKVSR